MGMAMLLPGEPEKAASWGSSQVGMKQGVRRERRQKKWWLEGGRGGREGTHSEKGKK